MRGGISRRASLSKVPPGQMTWWGRWCAASTRMSFGEAQMMVQGLSRSSRARAKKSGVLSPARRMPALMRSASGAQRRMSSRSASASPGRAEGG